MSFVCAGLSPVGCSGRRRKDLIFTITAVKLGLQELIDAFAAVRPNQ